jgi:hypothetical protein
MSHAFPTTRYFAVGFFTAAQLEEKHRAMLTRAAVSPAPVPDIQTSIHSVDVTIFGSNTGTDGVDVCLSTVARTSLDSAIGAKRGSFVIEPIDSTAFPPAGVTAQAAFEDYLASVDGQHRFGTATAVQLLSMSVDASSDSPAYWTEGLGSDAKVAGVGRAIHERAN